MHHSGLNLVLGKMLLEIIRGDQRIFIEQIREGAHLTSGKFMQGIPSHDVWITSCSIGYLSNSKT